VNPILRLAYLSLRGWWWLRRPLSVGVRVLLLQEGSVLLVRHSYRPHWHLPGGGVDRGETLEQAARREAAEEVGATLRSVSFVGIYTNFWNGRSDHVALFSSDDLEHSGSHDWEIAEQRWFDLRRLPRDLSPGTARRLAELCAEAQPSVGRW